MTDRTRINIGFNREPSPCTFCKPEEHYEACHGSCKKYLKWAEEGKRLKKKRDDYCKGPEHHIDQIWIGKSFKFKNG